MDKLLKILATGLLCLYGTLLSAQSPYTLTSSNADKVTLSIASDYSHQMSITASKLQAHLESLIDDQSYCKSCTHTEFDRPESENGALTLSWPKIIDATQYEVQYINLETNKTASYTTTKPSLTIKNLPEATYAFSLVTYIDTHGNPLPTRGDIIILEMPILMVGSYTQDCSCTQTAPTDLPVVGGSIAYFEPFGGEKYEIHFAFSAGTNLIVTLEAIEVAYGPSAAPIAFILHCDSDDHDNANNLFFQSNVLHMDYDEGLYLFETYTQNEQLVNVTLYKCGSTVNPNGRLSAENDAIRIYPNPSSDVLNVSLNEMGYGSPVILQIYNQFGKLLSNVRHNSPTAAIDVRNLPNGKYELRAIPVNQTRPGRNIQTMSFLKVE